MVNKRKHHHHHRCGFCDELFSSNRNDAKYCSNTCRQKAYNLRGAIWVVKNQIEHHERNYRNYYSQVTRFRPFEIENVLSDLSLFRNRTAFKTLPRDHELRTYYDEVLMRKYQKLMAVVIGKSNINGMA